MPTYWRDLVPQQNTEGIQAQRKYWHDYFPDARKTPPKMPQASQTPAVSPTPKPTPKPTPGPTLQPAATPKPAQAQTPVQEKKGFGRKLLEGGAKVLEGVKKYVVDPALALGFFPLNAYFSGVESSKKAFQDTVRKDTGVDINRLPSELTEEEKTRLNQWRPEWRDVWQSVKSGFKGAQEGAKRALVEHEHPSIFGTLSAPMTMGHYGEKAYTLAKQKGEPEDAALLDLLYGYDEGLRRSVQGDDYTEFGDFLFGLPYVRGGVKKWRESGPAGKATQEYAQGVLNFIGLEDILIPGMAIWDDIADAARVGKGIVTSTDDLIKAGQIGERAMKKLRKAGKIGTGSADDIARYVLPEGKGDVFLDDLPDKEAKSAYDEIVGYLDEAAGKVPVSALDEPNYSKRMMDITDSYIQKWRKEKPILTYENWYFTGSDPDPNRGAARYIEEYWNDLPEEVQDFWMKQKIIDLETGEINNVYETGVRGGHVWQVRQYLDQMYLDELEDAGKQATKTSNVKGSVDDLLATGKPTVAEFERMMQSDPDAAIKAVAPYLRDSKKVAFFDQSMFLTPERVMERQFGEYWPVFKKYYYDPLMDATGQYARNIRAAEDELLQVMNDLGIKQGSKEAAAVQWFGEGVKPVTRKVKGQKVTEYIPYGLNDLKAEFPNNWEQIAEADKYFRGKYDEFFREINRARLKNYPYAETLRAEIQGELDRTLNQLQNVDTQIKGKKRTDTKVYKTLQARRERLQMRADSLKAELEDPNLLRNKQLEYRKNYYHHFQEKPDTLGSLFNPLDNRVEISPSLVNVSDYTEPKSKWSGIFQRRTGAKTDADAIKGMRHYLPAAEYAKTVDTQIPKWRDLKKSLVEATEETKNLNNFIAFVDNFTNTLAGKTNPIDRFLTKTGVTRSTLEFLNRLNRRVKVNAVLGNVSSALAQVLNVPNAIAKVKNPRDIMSGVKHFIQSLGDDGHAALYKQSNFLSERFLERPFDPFETSMLKKPKQFASWLLLVGDEAGTKAIWSMFYDNATRRGIDSPIRYADDWTRRMVGGRGIGQVALAQQSKFMQLLMPFTLEVSNTMQVYGDMIRSKDLGGILTLMVTSNVANDILEHIRGSGALFDPIEAGLDAVGITGNLLDQIGEWMGADVEGYRRDEKWADMPVGEKILRGAGRLGGEYLSNIALGQNLAALYPEEGTPLLPESIRPTRAELFGEGDPTRFGTQPLFAKGLSDPLFTLLTPWGGQQLKKTIQGAQNMFSEDQPTSGSYMRDTFLGGIFGEPEKLRFPIEDTPGRAVQSLLFGGWATPEAREYFDKNRKSLGEKQTETFNTAVEAGIDPIALYDEMMKWREKGLDKKGERQKSLKLNKDLSDEDKRAIEQLFLMTDKQSGRYDRLQKYGMPETMAFEVVTRFEDDLTTKEKRGRYIRDLDTTAKNKRKIAREYYGWEKADEALLPTLAEVLSEKEMDYVLNNYDLETLMEYDRELERRLKEMEELMK